MPIYFWTSLSYVFRGGRDGRTSTWLIVVRRGIRSSVIDDFGDVLRRDLPRISAAFRRFRRAACRPNSVSTLPGMMVDTRIPSLR